MIFCFGSETRFAELVEQFGAGESVSAMDENGLVCAISDQKNGMKCCNGAYQLFNILFSRTKNTEVYARTIQI